MRKLIVPNFSMRSYETGKYAILKDGNFQLHLHRAQKDDYIVVPFNSSDSAELVELFPDYNFIQFPYGYNVENTRDYFWSWNQANIDSVMEMHNLEVLVTDIAGYCGSHPYIYNLNVTKSERWAKDIIMIAGSLRTYVLNEHVKIGCSRLDKVLAEKLIVCQKVINPEIMDRYTLGLDHARNIEPGQVFHPFRISDKCYDIKSVVKYCSENNVSLFITDPNDTWKDYEGWLTDAYPNVKVIRKKLSKLGYYAHLITQPYIVYNENPDEVFHPGLGELIYFKANIKSEYNMPHYDDVVLKRGEDVWLA